MKNNAFFEEFERIGREWNQKHTAHVKLKEEIIKTRGWDSPELKAWYAEEEEMVSSIPQGAMKAYRAYPSSFVIKESVHILEYIDSFPL